MQLEVVDLCVLLQCVGFKIKSLDSVESDTTSQESGVGRIVNLVCNRSGLSVVLESESAECSCPASEDEHTSGFWQVSGVSNGVVHTNKETGSSLVGSLPQQTKSIITRELHKLVQYSRNQANPSCNGSKIEDKLTRCVLFNELSGDHMANRTTSMTEINQTPPGERRTSYNPDTPTRYRSLDTLTNLKNLDAEIPNPGRLVAKTPAASDTSDFADDAAPKPATKIVGPYKRQQTYTMSTPDESANILMKSKTSSPIGKLTECLMQGLLSAEKSAELLRNKLANLVKEAMADEDRPGDCSVASLALDVSKISMQKGPDPPSKSRFVSSPNISGLSKRLDSSTSTIKRGDSSSTSQLNVRQTPTSLKAPSRLKRLSPSFFRLKKDDSIAKQNGDGVFKKNVEKTQNRFTSLLKPRTSTGVASPAGLRTPTTRSVAPDSGASTLSAAKKKMYSHVKSTIPKPTSTSKKE